MTAAPNGIPAAPSSRQTQDPVPGPARTDEVRVVVFTGGRGAQVLSSELVTNPHVRLTLAVNGYDDGKSTGAVRRLLGDALGPSDFRKNAFLLARQLGSCPSRLLDVLEHRFDPAGAEALALVDLRAAALADGGSDEGGGDLQKKVRLLGAAERQRLAPALALVLPVIEAAPAFRLADCSVGNLVFAGCFLGAGRRFNSAVDAYLALVGLPAGIIENVSDGRNAYLVAIDREGRLLASEADIVDQQVPRAIDEIFLVDRPIDDRLDDVPAEREALRSFLRARTVEIPPNPRLLARLADADVIIYAPGTQYSSLLPSYLTSGLGAALARNLRALKVLITNIHEDAEIAESSAVDIIQRAVFHLRRKGRDRIPVPCLVTHYLMNEPGTEEGMPYVPLGQVERLEDPRLVRVADFEDGVSGRHDATRVVTPFVRALLGRGKRPRVGILLLETRSANKIVQTVLEAFRGGLADLPMRFVVYCSTDDPLEVAAIDGLPFEMVCVPVQGPAHGDTWASDIVRDETLDDLILFESSGAYRGEDIVSIASMLLNQRVDAVWGSRRLSVRDIRESYRFRYRRDPATGAISYLGSYALSLAYLLLYGRYVSDTLSGVRGIRAARVRAAALDLASRSFNQHALSAVLRAGGEILETPVRFVPLSPTMVRRTTVGDGIRALLAIAWWRVRGEGRTAARRADHTEPSSASGGHVR